MIRASGLTLRRGTKVLLDETDFVINPGERVGIVGKNGAGKSTLFALLQGTLDADAGSLSMTSYGLGTRLERRRREYETEHCNDEHVRVREIIWPRGAGCRHHQDGFRPIGHPA